MIFEPLPTDVGLSSAGLEQAALRLGPSFTYDLYVHEENVFYARHLVKVLLADVLGNPFAPHINLETYHFRNNSTWVLAANDRKVGSVGVP